MLRSELCARHAALHLLAQRNSLCFELQHVSVFSLRVMFRCFEFGFDYEQLRVVTFVCQCILLVLCY